jgi:hypothetical protein
MNWTQLTSGVKAIWENKPVIIWLLLLGFAVFVYLVVDARRHKKRHGKKLPRKH